MKKVMLALGITILSSNLLAKTYVCSFDKLGIVQIDLDAKENRFCQFAKNAATNKYDKVESGYAQFSKNYYDNQSNEYRSSFEAMTLKRTLSFSIPKNPSDNFQMHLDWSMASAFGPLINAGYAEGFTGTCFEKTNVAPCAADRFVQPANTPKDFEQLKLRLEENEKDYWGDYPTFTIVSPDLKEFRVFTKTTNGGAEVCGNNGYGCESAGESDLLKEEVLPLLAKKWSLVPVYSNKSGTDYFNKIGLKK